MCNKLSKILWLKAVMNSYFFPFSGIAQQDGSPYLIMARVSSASIEALGSKSRWSWLLAIFQGWALTDTENEPDWSHTILSLSLQNLVGAPPPRCWPLVSGERGVGTTFSLYGAGVGAQSSAFIHDIHNTHSATGLHPRSCWCWAVGVSLCDVDLGHCGIYACIFL